MVKDKSIGEKLVALREHYAFNPRTEAVTDQVFTSDNPFFNPRDVE